MLAAVDAVAEDVSGFGLIGALDSLLIGHNVRASVDWAQVPILHDRIADITVEDLDGSRGYLSNRISATGNEQVMRISEFNGPVVCLVPSSHAKDFAVQANRRGFYVVSLIGTWYA